jgi:hypothetical protein
MVGLIVSEGVELGLGAVVTVAFGPICGVAEATTILELVGTAVELHPLIVMLMMSRKGVTPHFIV